MYLYKCLLILISIFTPATAGVFNFIKKAEAERIYEDPVWLLLLQYEDGESKIDDPSFYLSPKGKRDPKKELVEFLKTLKENPSIKCKFPARYYFLRKKLNLPYGSETECREVREFLKELKGNRLSIVFADSHINSPASMFGHTFLRIFDKEKDVASYIINYAAVTDESFGPLYAFKGIFGFYKGYYSIAPFYMKIKEYSAMEGRDLWEYEISIDAENLYLLKLHLYEIKDTFSYYYFFQENCSTNVFYLINFKNPYKRLKVKTFWVIPMDTIKVLFREGYVKKVIYEPSIITKLNIMKSKLNKKEINLIKEWAFSNVNLPEGEKRVFYEFASEYLRFLYYSKKIGLNEYRKKLLEALRKRSKIKEEKISYTYIRSAPHISHDSQRVAISYGYSEEYYIGFSYRPAYHDLLDKPTGYKPNSEIVFSDISFIYFLTSGKFLLERWKIIRIISLEPITEIYKPVSWKVDFGIKRRYMKYSIYLNTGGGYTLKIHNFSLFFLPDVMVLSNPWEITAGLNTGVLNQHRFLSFIINTKGGFYISEKSKGRYGNIEVALNISPFNNLSFRMGVNYDWKGGKENIDLFGSTNIYF